MTAMRRVALVLHALTPDDREWMLAQFDTHERESLRSLLDELERLGLMRDPTLVREATGRRAPDERSSANSANIAANDARVHAIAGVPPSVAVHELVDEPAAVLAFILSVHPWPWRSAVLDALGRAKREQVEALGAARAALADRTGHALCAVLIEELATRVSTSKVRLQTTALTRQTRWWGRLSWRRS